jgi:predicted Zn-dependent peptidase
MTTAWQHTEETLLFEKFKEHVHSYRHPQTGARIFVVSMETFPTAMVCAAFGCGSNNEHKGTRGLCHVVEHLAFKKTLHFNEGDVNKIARIYGAKMNAFTSNDTTAFYAECPNEDTERFIDVISEMVTNLEFDEQHLRSERHAVLEEYRSGQDSPDSVMFHKVQNELFGPYEGFHYPVIGDVADILACTPEILGKFFRENFTADRMAIIIAGNFPAKAPQILAKARQSFAPLSDIRPRASPPNPFSHVWKQMGKCVEHTVCKIPMDTAHPHLNLAWRTPGYDGDPSLVGQNIAHVLTGDDTSVLRHQLVDVLRLAVAVNVSAYQWNSAGCFIANIVPLEGKDEECIQTANQIIHDLGQPGNKDAVTKSLGTFHAQSLFSIADRFTSAKGFVVEVVQGMFCVQDIGDVLESTRKSLRVTHADIKAFLETNMGQPWMCTRVDVVPATPQEQAAIRQKKQIESKVIMGVASRTGPVVGSTSETLAKQWPSRSSQILNDILPFPRVSRKTLGNSATLQISHVQSDEKLCTMYISLKGTKGRTNTLGSKIATIVAAMFLEASAMGYTENDMFFSERGISIDSSGSGLTARCFGHFLEDCAGRLVEIWNSWSLSPKTFEKYQRKALVNAKNTMKNTSALAVREICTKLYGVDHTRGWTYPMLVEALENITPETLTNFRNNIMDPENMVITVVVPLSYGGLDRVGEVWQGVRTSKLGKKASLMVGKGHPDVEDPVRSQSALAWGKRTGIPLSDTHMSAGICLLEQIMVRSMGSKVWDLRESTGLFYAAGGQFSLENSLDQTDTNTALFYMTTDHKNAEKAVQQVNHLWAECMEGKQITNSDVDDARVALVADFIPTVKMSHGIARMFGDLEAGGFPEDHYVRLFEACHKWDPASLTLLLKQRMSLSDMVFVKVGQ